MKKINWEDSIKKWSEKRLEISGDEKYNLPPDILESGYLGYLGATEQEIADVEAYLEITLPPSYREFLKVSNGLRIMLDSDWTFDSVQQIEWFKFIDQITIDALREGYKDDIITDEEYFVYGDKQCPLIFRPEYLQTALAISSEHLGAAIFLLNPKIITSEGEWEAWLFDMSPPAYATRYRSFGEMMEMILSDPTIFL